MTRTIRVLMTTIVLGACALPGTARAQDAQTCQPGVANAFNGPRHTQYQSLGATLGPQVSTFNSELAALVGQTPTYDTLLAHANTVAAMLATGRVVVTIPDGTVVVDTGKGGLNTYANYLAKAINENHNSRVAIFEAQAYPCGIAVETKLSSSVGQKDSYLAVRLGTYLDSAGTVRMSVTAP